MLGADHHFVMWAYRGKDVATVPPGFSGHHVAGVRQAAWTEVEPHPTDMPILNDAGAAAYPRALIEDRMRSEGIVMTNLLTGEVYGARG